MQFKSYDERGKMAARLVDFLMPNIVSKRRLHDIKYR